MAVIERQTVIATKDKDGNTVMHYPVTSVKYVEGAVCTVNGIEPDANGDVLVAGLPIGHEWFTTNPNIPTGCLPLFGGTFSRTAYADLWAWVQTQGSYLITEAEWQEKATANEGNVAFYSDGDGSTTFRVPSLKCHVQGANGVEEVGGYLKAGLPNITGSAQSTGGNDTAAFENTAGAFDSEKGSYKPHSASSSKYANLSNIFSFDASLSNPIYGNSDTVQPPSIVGMYLVKAFGTVSNIGNQDIADVSAGLTRVENKMDEYTDNVAYIDSFIVETWRSDDGSSWYRKYSDGWLEQGGTFGSGTSGTITFPKAFSAEVYLTFGVDYESNSRDKTAFVYTESLTGFTWDITDSSRGYWHASGR
ncbi:MAG: hypothetical protein IJN28_05150 [Selenomonadales bacterium]|nr:hypothetical protein [Selenomonadales bacterium]